MRGRKFVFLLPTILVVCTRLCHLCLPCHVYLVVVAGQSQYLPSAQLARANKAGKALALVLDDLMSIGEHRAIRQR